MYDIVVVDISDPAIMMAVNTIVSNDTENNITSPENNNYRLLSTSLENGIEINGDGGTNQHTVVIVGHASENGFAEYRKWSNLQKAFSLVDWKNAKQVYLVACSTAGDNGTKFLYGNIANEAKSHLPQATIWASEDEVYADNLEGTWNKL